MAHEANIRLDIDEVGPAKAREEVSRLIVAVACGYTRDGAAATITEDCQNIRTLEAEARRLKSEIDDAVDGARAHYGEKAGPGTEDAVPDEKRGTAALQIDRALKVRDVMTSEVSTVDENAKLSVAEELMKVGEFRHVVVLHDTGTVAGVISQTDIFHGALAWSLGLGESGYEKTLSSYPAKQVMSTPVVTVDPEADLSKAADLMIQHRISCVPVVEGTTLVGIISDGDFLSLLTRATVSA